MHDVLDKYGFEDEDEIKYKQKCIHNYFNRGKQ